MLKDGFYTYVLSATISWMGYIVIFGELGMLNLQIS